MAHAGVDRLRSPSGRPVAQAVGVGAQVRAALDHLAADPELGLGRVDSSSRDRRPGSSPGRNTAIRRRRGERLVHQSSVHSQTLPAMSKRPNPLAGRLPRRGAVRRKPLSPVLRHGKSGPSQVFAISLPSGRTGTAPGVRRPVEAAARGVLPLRLGRKGRSGPGGVRRGVWCATCTTGSVEDLVDRAFRALRCLQEAPGLPAPPLAEVAQVDRPARVRSR